MGVQVTDGLIRELEGIFGPKNVSVDPTTRRAHSTDYSWFSPLLKERVKGALADVVVWAEDAEQLKILAASAENKGVPIVVRGAGTGNYAQCVPLFGGIVVDTTRMKRIVEIEDGRAIVEPGVRLGELKAQAEEVGLTLRVYPSTYVVSTVAGFVEGGSGGVGSVEYGRLWDDNVSQIRLVAPRGEWIVGGEQLKGVIHSAGTTGLLTEVTLPLAHKRELIGVVAGFPTLADSIRFCLRLASSHEFVKRVVSLYEPAVARYFAASVEDRVLRGRVDVFGEMGDSYVAIAIFEASGGDAVTNLLSQCGATATAWLGGEEAELLSDYTFNHTTLWASKQEKVTWQHVFFDQSRVVEQSLALKRLYGEKVLLHYEFVKGGEGVVAAGLPIVFYDDPSQLVDMLDEMKKLGVSVENIHSYQLEDRLSEDKLSAIRRLKRMTDPGNILNPGKLRSM